MLAWTGDVPHGSGRVSTACNAVDATLSRLSGRAHSAARLVQQAGGECRPEGGFKLENALRGSWKLRCRDSDRGLYITLAPTEPAAVQFLQVTPLARDEDTAPAPVCR